MAPSTPICSRKLSTYSASLSKIFKDFGRSRKLSSPRLIEPQNTGNFRGPCHHCGILHTSENALHASCFGGETGDKPKSLVQAFVKVGSRDVDIRKYHDFEPGLARFNKRTLCPALVDFQRQSFRYT